MCYGLAVGLIWRIHTHHGGFKPATGYLKAVISAVWCSIVMQRDVSYGITLVALFDVGFAGCVI